MLMKELTSGERSQLRARAHPLAPVVIIGNAGLTGGVLAEIEISLKAHELIKIRVGGAEHAERETMLGAICAHTGAAPVQHIGKILVLFREKPKDEAAARPRVVRAKTDPNRKKAGRKPAARTRGKESSGRDGFGAQRRPSTKRR
jgi:RNA-binding protein